MIKIKYNRASIWLYVLILTISFIFISLTLKPVKEMFDNNPTDKKPIEEAGYGPFDYGMDASSAKLSDSTVGTMNYVGDQKKKADTGSFHGNIFSYTS